jgi:hypothetical protein
MLQRGLASPLVCADMRAVNGHLEELWFFLEDVGWQ